MGDAARKLAQCYRWSEVAPRLAAWYEKGSR